MQIIRLNIALVALEQSRFEIAQTIRTEIDAEMEASGRRLLQTLVRAVELGCAVGLGQQTAAATCLSTLEALLSESGMKDWDLGRVAVLCAQRAVGWSIEGRLRAMAAQQGMPLR